MRKKVLYKPAYRRIIALVTLVGLEGFAVCQSFSASADLDRAPIVMARLMKLGDNEGRSLN